MGKLRDYIERKRGERELKREESDKTKRLNERLDRESLKVDAKESRRELKELKAARKAKKDVQAVKDYRRQSRQEGSFVGRVGRGFEAMGSSLDEFQRSNRRTIGGPKKKGRSKRRSSGGDGFMGPDLIGSFGGGMIGGNDLMGGMFNSPMPQRRKKYKKKR